MSAKLLLASIPVIPAGDVAIKHPKVNRSCTKGESKYRQNLIERPL